MRNKERRPLLWSRKVLTVARRRTQGAQGAKCTNVELFRRETGLDSLVLVLLLVESGLSMGEGGRATPLCALG